MQARGGTVDPLTAGGIWRQSRSDGVLVAGSLAHAGLLASAAAAEPEIIASALLIAALAIALWWNGNTVSHHFMHLPFFRSPRANAAYSVFLSLLLAVPQTLWREKHFAHHAGRAVAFRWSSQTVVEAVAVAALWFVLLAAVPAFFLTIYVPAILVGMGLGVLHGHFEHAPAVRSYYGRVYNRLLFNDGFHVEHHERPGSHWASLPAHGGRGEASPFPPLVRWLEHMSLAGLERLALKSRRLQRFVLDRHERALRRLLPEVGTVHAVTVVGGGLFPRTVIILRKLLPEARIRVVDLSRRNLETARRFLSGAGLDEGVELVCGRFVTGHDGAGRVGSASFDSERFDSSQPLPTPDLLVTPLSLTGDRNALYAKPPARYVIVHDWIWRRGPSSSARVSWLLLKRMNLLRGTCLP